ncbi:MAG TPA: MBL fold metallo-hydrolase [Mesorhizobium sp.]|nr:MBL fold metallo-hydrolase [Mesorhizobium sp.]
MSQGGAIEVLPDLAFFRCGIANLIFVGPRDAGDRNWVLVDAGVMGWAEQIRTAAGFRFGIGARPTAIVLTHGHFDHVGALKELAEEWDAPVYAHRLEHPYLNGTAAYPPADPWVGGGLVALLSKVFPRGPVDVGERLHALPEDGTVPGLGGWRWIHTPGHAPGHVSLWRERDRTLIAGDAFVTTAQESIYEVLTQEPELHGPPRYFTPDWHASGVSVQVLSAFEPEVVVTGHGEALRGPKMRAALERLAKEFDEVAVPKTGVYVERPERAEDGSAYHRA